MSFKLTRPGKPDSLPYATAAEALGGPPNGKEEP
jgi:hypothetical protein